MHRAQVPQPQGNPLRLLKENTHKEPLVKSCAGTLAHIGQDVRLLVSGTPVLGNNGHDLGCMQTGFDIIGRICATICKPTGAFIPANWQETLKTGAGQHPTTGAPIPVSSLDLDFFNSRANPVYKPARLAEIKRLIAELNKMKGDMEAAAKAAAAAKGAASAKTKKQQQSSMAEIDDRISKLTDELKAGGNQMSAAAFPVLDKQQFAMRLNELFPGGICSTAELIIFATEQTLTFNTGLECAVYGQLGNKGTRPVPDVEKDHHTPTVTMLRVAAAVQIPALVNGVLATTRVPESVFTGFFSASAAKIKEGDFTGTFTAAVSSVWLQNLPDSDPLVGPDAVNGAFVFENPGRNGEPPTRVMVEAVSPRMTIAAFIHITYGIPYEVAYNDPAVLTRYYHGAAGASRLMPKPRGEVREAFINMPDRHWTYWTTDGVYVVNKEERATLFDNRIGDLLMLDVLKVLVWLAFRIGNPTVPQHRLKQGPYAGVPRLMTPATTGFSPLSLFRSGVLLEYVVTRLSDRARLVITAENLEVDFYGLHRNVYAMNMGIPETPEKAAAAAARKAAAAAASNGASASAASPAASAASAGWSSAHTPQMQMMSPQSMHMQMMSPQPMHMQAQYGNTPLRNRPREPTVADKLVLVRHYICVVIRHNPSAWFGLTETDRPTMRHYWEAAQLGLVFPPQFWRETCEIHAQLYPPLLETSNEMEFMLAAMQRAFITKQQGMKANVGNPETVADNLPVGEELRNIALQALHRDRDCMLPWMAEALDEMCGGDAGMCDFMAVEE